MNPIGSKKPILLPCPRCGECEVNIGVALGCFGDEAHEALFRCYSCDTDFGTEEVRRFIGRWSPILAWIDNAPEFDDD